MVSSISKRNKLVVNLKKLFLLSVVLFSLTASAFDATIETDIDLVAGDTKTIDLSFDGESEQVHLTYSCDENIDVSFSENNFKVNGDKTITVTISTPNNLAPDDYDIYIYYEYKEVSNGGGSITIHTNPSSKKDPVDPLPEPEPEPEPEPDPEPEDPVDDDDDDDTIQEEDDEKIVITINRGYPFEYYAAAVGMGALILISVFYIIYKKRKRGKK